MTTHTVGCYSFNDRIAPYKTAESVGRPEWCICGLTVVTDLRERIARDIEAHCLRNHDAFRGTVENRVVCWKCRETARVAREATS